MRKKNKAAFILLCSALAVTAIPASGMDMNMNIRAEEEQTDQNAEVSTPTPAQDFFNKYGPDKMPAEQFKAVLDAYKHYLSQDQAFKDEADALWKEQGTYESVEKHANAAIAYINGANLDRELLEELSGMVRMLNDLGGKLDPVQVPDAPVDPEDPKDPTDPADPDNPENPKPGDGEDPDKPSKPGEGDEEDPKDPVNPDEGKDPEKPGDSEDNKDPEKPGDEDDKKDPSDSDNKDEGDNKKPVTPGDINNSDSSNSSTSNNNNSGSGNKKDDQNNRTPGTAPEVDKTKPNIAIASPAAYSGTLNTLSKTQNRKITVEGVGSYNLLPNFNNTKAWKNSVSAYNTPFLWGQCTWFAWGRFYEIYGFNPGFTGNGYACVGQLLNAHPDKFELSRTPASGAVFSSDTAHNHVGIVLEYDPDTKMLVMQEGNLDIVSNPIWNEAIQDWRTVKVSESDMRAMYGDVTYAVPKTRRISAAKRAEAKRKAAMSLRNLAIEKFKKSYKAEPLKKSSTSISSNKKTTSQNKTSTKTTTETSKNK